MAERDRVKVEEGLRFVVEGLGPWMGQRVGVWPPDKGGSVQPHDIAYLIAVLLERRGAFKERVRIFWRDLFGVVAESLTWMFFARPV